MRTPSLWRLKEMILSTGDKATGGEVKVTDLREAIFQKQYYRVKLLE